MITQSDRGYSGEFWQLGVAGTWIVGLPCWLLGVVLAEKIDTLTQAVSTRKIVLLRAMVFSMALVAHVTRFHFFVPYLVTLTLITWPIAKWLEAEIIYYKSNKPVLFLEKLGKISYSLYLCHPIIIAILLKLVPLNFYTYFGYLLFCVVVAYVFYLVLEKPSHFLAEKLSGRTLKRQA